MRPKKNTLSKKEMSQLSYGLHTMTEDKKRKKLVSELLAAEFLVSSQTRKLRFSHPPRLYTFPVPVQVKASPPPAPKSSSYYEFTQIISPRTGRWLHGVFLAITSVLLEPTTAN